MSGPRRTPAVPIDPAEVQITAVRAQGAGGQNVNKVSSAIHLRFDVAASSLPEDVKQRLLALRDARLTRQGELIVKAQQYRTQEANRQDALQRLQALVVSVAQAPRERRATRPTLASQQRRLQAKSRRADIKAQRGRAGSGLF